MSNVLSFQTASQNETPRMPVRADAACEVVIFPGVRRERFGDFEMQGFTKETHRSN